MEPCQTCSRRKFLGGLLTACGALSGLASTARAGGGPLPALSQALRLKISDYPLLAAAGGSTYLSHDGGATVLLINRGQGSQFFVLDPTCTHLGCRVDLYEFPPRQDFTQGQIACPCHGSAFAIDGRVVGGPAQTDLARYSCRFADGFLEVDVPGLVFGVSALTPVRSSSGEARVEMTFPSTNFSFYRLRHASSAAGPFLPVNFALTKDGALNQTQLTGNGAVKRIYAAAPGAQSFYQLELRIFELT